MSKAHFEVGEAGVARNASVSVRVGVFPILASNDRGIEKMFASAGKYFRERSLVT